MDYTPLHYIYKAAGKPAAYTLLLLHGTGGNEHDLLPLAANFGDGYNLLSVRGNVSEHGMPRFFRRLGMGIFDEEDLNFRTDELVAFVKEIAQTEGFDPSKVIALGYSNGANIAGATLVKYPGFLAGAILYRPMQPFKAINSQGTGNAVPVFMSSGLQDPTVAPGASGVYASLLEGLGFEVSHHEMNTGHNLTNSDITLSAEWLANHFS